MLDESALTEDREWTIAALMKELGWQGTARQFRVLGMTRRVAMAINQRAVSLGIQDVSLGTEPDGWNPAVPYAMVTATDTAAQHLAADNLIAYIEGLTDALSGEYGRQDEPVEVRRADLAAALAAIENPLGYFLGGGAEAVARLREALGR